MAIPHNYSFQRYLAAKKSVDDRALNQHVWKALSSELKQKSQTAAQHILEVGAGIGTMIERAIEWDLVSNAKYIAIDEQPEILETARLNLANFAAQNDLEYIPGSEEWISLRSKQKNLEIKLYANDLYEYQMALNEAEQYDLVIAHAFLDLVDITRALPVIFSMLRSSSLYYFSLNYDGLTILEPSFDPELDELIIKLYNSSMDQRLIDGKPSGDSRTGRRLYRHLYKNGATILEIGASDWVVYPYQNRYPADQAYFLHFLIHTIHKSLEVSEQLDQKDFTRWVNTRHEQIERGELVFIAHQLDYFGKI